MKDMDRFPIGIWNYVPADRQDASAVKDWADAGITVAQGPSFDPELHDKRQMLGILDEAGERGIKVIVCDKRSDWHSLDQGEAGYRAGFQQALRDFGKHPAVFGFKVGDEPGVRERPKEYLECCAAYRIQKEMAPELSPFANLLPWHPGVEALTEYLDWQRYLDAYVRDAHADFLCFDNYSQLKPGEEGWEQYFRNLREYGEAARRNRIPFWTTLLSVGHFRYRCPREDDFRWQLNTAVAHGAQGVLWFFFYMQKPLDNYRVAPIDEHWERTETYEWLSRVDRTFLKWHADVVRKLSLRKVMHVGKSWGGVPLFAPDELVASARSTYGNSLIVSELRDPAGRDYVMVVNNSPFESDQAELVLTGRRPEVYRVDWMAKEEHLTKGDRFSGIPRYGEDFAVLRPNLCPGQMELYRVEAGG
jgi:hypothetical protein